MPQASGMDSLPRHTRSHLTVEEVVAAVAIEVAGEAEAEVGVGVA